MTRHLGYTPNDQGVILRYVECRLNEVDGDEARAEFARWLAAHDAGKDAVIAAQAALIGSISEAVAAGRRTEAEARADLQRIADLVDAYGVVGPHKALDAVKAEAAADGLLSERDRIRGYTLNFGSAHDLFDQLMHLLERDAELVRSGVTR